MGSLFPPMLGQVWPSVFLLTLNLQPSALFCFLKSHRTHCFSWPTPWRPEDLNLIPWDVPLQLSFGISLEFTRTFPPLVVGTTPLFTLREMMLVFTAACSTTVSAHSTRLFFFKKISIYLTASSPSCGSQDLRFATGNLWLQCGDSLVVMCGLSTCSGQAPEHGLQELWRVVSLVVAHGPSHFVCEILASGPGTKTASPTLQGRSPTTEPPGES